METEKIIIYGGGGHAKVVIDCLQAQQRNIIAVIDNKNEGPLLGIHRIAKYASTFEQEALAIVAIGDNEIRMNVAKTIAHKFTNAIHPSVLFSNHAVLGKGNMLMQNSVIQAGVEIGNHVILNTGAQVDHDCKIGSYVHLAPRTTLCGNVHIGEGTLVGAGSVIIPGITVGNWVTIGAGTIVIKDVPDRAVVVGNPGQIIKYK
jgi:sugar O-acyltransferase (sialic acid O-acetyltransferase NeuD family)